jgi:ATP-dependent DNA ligase
MLARPNGGPDGWDSHSAEATKPHAGPDRTRPDASRLITAYPRIKPLSIGAKAPLPGFVEPTLASSIERVPAGECWIHEVKLDGYRVQVHPANAAVKIFTRCANNWTSRFKKIGDDAWHINAGSAIVDGRPRRTRCSDVKGTATRSNRS